MNMRMRAALLASALVAVVALPAGAEGRAAGRSTGTSATVAPNSPNMSHVFNLRHRKGSPTGAQVAGGTDIEFTTMTVPVGDEAGEPVCVVDELGACVLDDDGNTVYQTQERDFALAGTYQNGLQIVDITEPEAPVTTGVYDCAISQGDVQVFHRDGRTYVTYTSDNGYPVGQSSACVREAKALAMYGSSGYGTYIADITDPAAPVTVSFIGNPSGSHNQTVAPGGEYLYNSNSDIGVLDRLDPTDQTGRIEVYDIRDFAAPKQVATLPLLSGADSHDITFSADGKRAYTAALTHTLVLDTTDLAAPKVIGRIVDPAVNIHHQSDPVTLKDATTGMERTFLIVTDELAGAAGNAVCPGGGLHIYDITGPLEAAPVKVGFWNMPSARFTGTSNITCTSHVLRLHPDEKIMTIAWYNAGVRVVDISGLVGVSVGATEAGGNVGAGMREIGYHYFSNSDTWSAKTNRIEADGSFYLYGNDQARGLDVYRFDGSAQVAEDGGTWLTPKQALAQARLRGANGTVTSGSGPYCLYRGRPLRVG
ncbi:MAG: hypothetical protein M3245_02940 [Actinomycetota bacterium]|nr:hypothetical protein [Actinomycetota bacterium]